MPLTEYALLAFSSLFVIVDPIATVPAFLAMTPRDALPQRLRMARVACLVMVGVLARVSWRSAPRRRSSADSRSK